MKLLCLLLSGLFLPPALLSQVFKTENIRLEHTALGEGFEITGAIDTTENPIVYSQLLLKRNGRILLFDTTTYFFFTDAAYPLLLKTGGNSFQLLLETDGRPQLNGLLMLSIKNDSVVSLKNLPIFITGAANLDNDATLEYAGCIGYPEISTYMPYSPIVYYEIMPDGIQVDSTLTEDRNKFIYGKFYGYEYLAEQRHPLSRMDFYNKEIKRIKETSMR